MIEIMTRVRWYQELKAGAIDTALDSAMRLEVQNIVVSNIYWFLKFIPSFAALIIVYFFLRSMRDDLAAAEKLDMKAPEAPPRRAARKKA